MRNNCKCKKCGLEFSQSRTRSKIGFSVLYDTNWKPIKCDKKGCNGVIEAILHDKIQDHQTNLYSAQNKEYLNK